MSDASKSTVALYVRGLDFNPDDATALLAVTPTIARRKGDVRTTPSGTNIASKEGLWVLRLYSENKSVAEQIRELLARLNPAAMCNVRGLYGFEDAYIDVFVAPDASSKSKGEFAFELDASALTGLSGATLPVRFTIALQSPQESHESQ